MFDRAIVWFCQLLGFAGSIFGQNPTFDAIWMHREQLDKYSRENIHQTAHIYALLPRPFSLRQRRIVSGCYVRL